MPELPNRHRLRYALMLLGALVCVVGFVLLSFQVNGWMHDDAFISFRYAENLVHGHGLVYNPGVRVEGYTNFLWTLLLALFRLVGLNIVTVSRVLGQLLGVAALAATGYTVWRNRPGDSGVDALMPVALLASLGVFAAWSLSGMEVMLLAFLLVISFFLVQSATAPGVPNAELRTSVAAGSVLALAAMTRPEGLLAAAVLLVMVLTGPDRQRRGRNALLLLAGLVLSYLPYYIWRYAYYGYPLPNTYYAKVGFSWAQLMRGVRYLYWFALPHVPLLLFAVAGAIVKWRQLMVRTAAVLLLASAVYVAAVGGDHAPAFRFIAPVTPFICLLAAAGIETVVSVLRRKAVRVTASVLLTAALVVCNLLASFRSPLVFRAVASDHVAYLGRLAGELLAREARPGAVIATNTAGTIPYYSGLRTIDMLGLNDVHIAHLKLPMGRGLAGHEKWDAEYVLAQRPDYIQFGSATGNSQPCFRGDSAIWQLPEFRQLYRLRVYHLVKGKWLLGLYERKTSAAREE
jgi:hypothetical protein